MTPEQRQRKYSQELAEHTLRQWNSVRKGTLGETTERQKGLRKSPPKAVTPPQGEQDESDVKTPMREHNGQKILTSRHAYTDDESFHKAYRSSTMPNRRQSL